MRETFTEQLERCLRMAKRIGHKKAERYYAERLGHVGLVACVSFKTFKGSWAYGKWKERDVYLDTN